jgi:hypothetical protein
VGSRKGQGRDGGAQAAARRAEAAVPRGVQRARAPPPAASPARARCGRRAIHTPSGHSARRGAGAGGAASMGLRGPAPGLGARPGRGSRPLLRGGGRPGGPGPAAALCG